MKFCYLINGYINIYFVYNTYTYFTMKIHFKNKWKNKQEILNGKSWFICLLQNRFSRTMHNLPSKQTLLRAQEQLLSLSKYLFSTSFLVLLLIYWRYFSNHLNLHMQLLISESCFFWQILFYPSTPQTFTSDRRIQHTCTQNHCMGKHHHTALQLAEKLPRLFYFRLLKQTSHKLMLFRVPISVHTEHIPCIFFCLSHESSQVCTGYHKYLPKVLWK